jgi:hypothetical protein
MGNIFFKITTTKSVSSQSKQISGIFSENKQKPANETKPVKKAPHLKQPENSPLFKPAKKMPAAITNTEVSRIAQGMAKR